MWKEIFRPVSLTESGKLIQNQPTNASFMSVSALAHLTLTEKSQIYIGFLFPPFWLRAQILSVE